MNELSDSFLLATLAILILTSAFFSGSETGMMALNPYKLKHRVNSGHKGAKRASRLLEKPEKLIGIILIGNNLVNIGASAIATVLAMRWFGDAGVLIATGALTIIILIFAEVTPKTLAAHRPELIAIPASSVLTPLLVVFSPFVWLVNHASRILLRLLGLKTSGGQRHILSTDELKTVVQEGGKQISPTYKGMLLNILDLDKMTVEDIMVPRNEVQTIDTNDSFAEIEQQISQSEYTRIPIVNGDINDVVGILHLRNALNLFKTGDAIKKDQLIAAAHDAYFVPESTPLSTMLVNFQKQQRRIGLVVDEYGDVQGLVTLEDLLEEIVGRFTTDTNDDDDIIVIAENNFSIDATALVRDVNKALDWELPIDGPKTMNGLIVETLEQIPEAPVAIRIGNYILEAQLIDKQRIKTISAYQLIDAD
ncbi:HlyC/CorC family transporter [Umboniibacter marinipuniceus]|uniref:Magnesium and cobalt efflux protein CorC n=1 Tax=Umboniibacter marinipuniceus TaxID=569599 RepID=A0A3M0A969_9GAMM|nr:HlyC/CorC family transporter [Umboniibacter marinipuniceus]RMA81420.1 Mg2+/Co2+ transporter CorB [Umboniibacter marinipuniceus]